MTIKTRYAIVASALVIGVGIGTGLVAYYTSGRPARAVDAADDLRLVPPDAAVVVYANVRDVMTSEVRRRASAAVQGEETRRRRFEEVTAINLETDVDRVVVFVQAPPAGGGPAAIAMLAHGRFNEARIETLALEHGGAVDPYKGKRVVVSKPLTATPNMPAQQIALAFVEPGLAIVGSAGLVRGAIDRMVGAGNVMGNEPLMRLIPPPGSFTVWAVGRLDLLGGLPGARLPAGVAERMAGITWFSASGRVGTALDGTVRLEARDEPTATALRDIVRGLVSLARIQAAADPRLESVLQSFELAGTGNQIALSFSLPAAALDWLPHLPLPGR